MKHVSWRLSLSVLLLAGSAYLSACGGRVPAPSNFSDDPSKAHAVFHKRKSQILTLSGELSIEVWDGDERVRARQLFAAQPPQKLRVDTLSPFQQPISTLILNPNKIALHEIDQRRFRIGKPTAEQLGRISKLQLDPQTLATVLSGQPPLIQSAGGVLTWDSDRGLYKLTLTNESSTYIDRQELWFTANDFTVIELRMYRGGVLDVRIQLTDYTADEPKLPQRMRFELPNSSLRVEVKLKDYALNPDLPEEAFTITVPIGLRPEPI